MKHVFALLAAALFGSGVAEAQGTNSDTNDVVRLGVTVVDSVLLSGFSGAINRMGDVDPRFAVTLRIDSCAPALTNLHSGTIVPFAVHSPALFLSGNASKGTTHEITMSRKKAMELIPAGQTNKPSSMAGLLAASKPGDWRTLDPENTLNLELTNGRVVIELAPTFAPKHVANVKALARERYFDGLAILRAQDNYVVQWGDPNAEKPELARKIERARKTLPPEFDRTLDLKLPFTALPDGDVYAPEVGFSGGFPVARDKRNGKMWLVHTYGMVGAGRDNAPDSGGGTELYVVIGHSPRHLDRNVTLLGRVVQGMELLSALPRGSGAMGFYDKPEQRAPIKSIRVAADVPQSERVPLELLRTDTPLFEQLIESRRNRLEEWFQFSPGKIEIGNVPLPVRIKGASK
ncbi:MAG TPA: peptidylprolyl isomerase [Verrucomicrobiae bacterium]|nr:peptidylprolyl isomerase [Verrucomicrobiae bacterium]